MIPATKPDEPQAPSRREFCGAACGTTALATLGLPVLGCGNRVEPAPYLDANLDVNPSSATYGQVAIPLASYPQLAALGGAVTVRVLGTAPDGTVIVPQGGALLVHRDAPGAGDEFVAVQSLCPHQLCPLGYSAADDRVECPCHGSRFRAAADPAIAGSYAGQVTHLPARDDLSAWTVTLQAGILSVDFRSPLTAGAAGAMVVNGTITLPLSTLPALQTVGGSQLLSPAGLGDTLILLRKDAATVVTLSAICTHAGCKVHYAASPGDLSCPCHGSTFSLDGTVTGGIAPSPLKVYTTDFDGTTITVHVA